MMALGMFVFMPQTAPFQSIDRQVSWRHPSTARVGTRPARQFLGVDEESISIKGVLAPEITGSDMTLSLLETMANAGEAYPLITNQGQILGHFVIEQMTQNRSVFLPDGHCAKQEFSLTLKRVDD